MSNVTKEGIEVKVGQVWQDLDKRMEGRRVQVIQLVTRMRRNERIPSAIIAVQRHDGGHWNQSTIAIRRMYKHSTGWKLVQDV